MVFGGVDARWCFRMELALVVELEVVGVVSSERFDGWVSNN